VVPGGVPHLLGVASGTHEADAGSPYVIGRGLALAERDINETAQDGGQRASLLSGEPLQAFVLPLLELDLGADLCHAQSYIMMS
jgi:hypothetical protein